MERPQTYDLTSRVNHWIIAAVIIGMLGLGLFLEYGGLEREAKRPLIDIHKSIGVLVLAFGLWRVLWRVFQGFPPIASTMPAWQETASKTIHWLLLAGILVMSVSGVLSSIFRGRAVDVFGWFTIPAQTELPWLASLASSTHDVVGKALAVIVIIHVAAALKHHIQDADPTLRRMLTG
ncbi:MAG: cytochrome b [Geminicoccaceae bacterium]